MTDKQYLTISEYAKLKGISKQAVYKQLNKKLKEFVKEVDGVKRIDISALSEAEKEKLNEVDEQIEQQFNNGFQPSFWQEQLEKKDEQIASLLQQIESLTRQNENLTDLLKGSQVLSAVDKKLYLDSGQSQEKKHKGIFGGLFKRRGKKDEE